MVPIKSPRHESVESLSFLLQMHSAKDTLRPNVIAYCSPGVIRKSKKRQARDFIKATTQQHVGLMMGE